MTELSELDVTSHNNFFYKRGHHPLQVHLKLIIIERFSCDKDCDSFLDRNVCN